MKLRNSLITVGSMISTGFQWVTLVFGLGTVLTHGPYRLGVHNDNPTSCTSPVNRVRLKAGDTNEKKCHTHTHGRTYVLKLFHKYTFVLGTSFKYRTTYDPNTGISLSVISEDVKSQFDRCLLNPAKLNGGWVKKQ